MRFYTLHYVIYRDERLQLPKLSLNMPQHGLYIFRIGEVGSEMILILLCVLRRPKCAIREISLFVDMCSTFP